MQDQVILLIAAFIHLVVIYIVTIILSAKERDDLKNQVERFKGLYESERERYKYNGWKNYQTWNYKLWIDNDEGLHNYFCEQARELNLYDLQECLRDYIEDNDPFNEIPLDFCYSDLLGAAINSIGFYEIAKALKEENTEIENYQEAV